MHNLLSLAATSASSGINLYRWRQIRSPQIAESPGIYAWYYIHRIGDYDLDEFVEKVKNAELAERKVFIESFLKRHLFANYEESPYTVSLRGKLKPKFSGLAYHEQQIAPSLVERLADQPELVRWLRDHVEASAVSFSSPLYIGMTDNLLKRLVTHKWLIEKYRSDGVPRHTAGEDDCEIKDHNFASRIIERKFVETNLCVLTKCVQSDDALNVILENVLNRINYPILGRN